ncbi:hypothetical protein JYP46_01555 [Nitratireductor aquimarinus]|nr:MULTISPECIES: hypothetical protein [Alphaproteobacteria]MBN7755497.1 hypothetical protein [Nitratireductor aquimarinus]MBY5998252.1 hypothetical protein [Tritonibacter mobilis]MBY6020280.1 hypothetical protein [Nitratireductor sp. DP7N14-4]
MRKFVIDENLAQAIADYLAARPYREVAQLVAGLMALQEIKEDETLSDGE